MPQLTFLWWEGPEAWDLGASLTDSTEHEVCPLVKAERLSGVGRNSACKHSQCRCLDLLFIFQRIGITIQ